MLHFVKIEWLYQEFLQLHLCALDVLHGWDVDEFEMLLTAKLSCHVSELLCYSNQTQVQVELCRKCYYPVPKYTYLELYIK